MREADRAACMEALQKLVEQGEAEAAVLATSDGLPIVHTVHPAETGDSVAAMAASLLAIADAMAQQFGAGAEKAREVVVGTPGRTIALVHVGENMALAVAGRQGVRLGMLLSQARQAAENVMDIMRRAGEDAAERRSGKAKAADLEELVRRVLQEAAEMRRK